MTPSTVCIPRDRSDKVTSQILVDASRCGRQGVMHPFQIGDRRPLASSIHHGISPNTQTPCGL